VQLYRFVVASAQSKKEKKIRKVDGKLAENGEEP